MLAQAQGAKPAHAFPLPEPDDWFSATPLPAPVTSLAEHDDYLTHEEDGTVYPGVEINAGGYHGAEVKLYRKQDDVWLNTQKAGFTFSLKMSPAEARLIFEAGLKAVEDAEEFARQLQAEEDYQINLADDRDREMELVREAEARGEEYIPTAIGVEHMYAIEVAMLFGGELRPWQEELKPKVIYSEHANGAAGAVELEGREASASWRLRHSAAHPLVYQIVASHAPTALSGLRTAVPDDFGTLTRVPADLLAIVAPLPEQVLA